MILVPENGRFTGAEIDGTSKGGLTSLVQMEGGNPRENGLSGRQEDSSWKKWPA